MDFHGRRPGVATPGAARAAATTACTLSLAGVAILAHWRALSGAAGDREKKGKNTRKRALEPARKSKCDHVTRYTHEPLKSLKKRTGGLPTVTWAFPRSYD
jgi:hypothetical protein